MAKKIIKTPFPIRTSINNIDIKFIGDTVKAKRTGSGFTQHDAALYCGVPVEVFTKLEKGQSNITLTSFLSVVNGLGLKIEIMEL